MKSFADWTDEIRALMNPPAPMADTCNFVIDPKITAWDLAAGIDKTEYGLRKSMALEDFRKMYSQEWPRTIGFDLGAPEGDMTGAAIAHKYDGRTCFDRLREEGLRDGRRTGKSRMQQEMNELYGRLADHIGGVQFDEAYRDMLMTGHGVTKIIVDEFHDEVQVKHVPIDDLATPLYVVGPQLKLAEKWANSQGWLSGPFTYISRAEQLRCISRGTELVMMVNWHSNKTKAEVDDFCDLIAAYELKVRLVQL